MAGGEVLARPPQRRWIGGDGVRSRDLTMIERAHATARGLGSDRQSRSGRLARAQPLYIYSRCFISGPVWITERIE